MSPYNHIVLLKEHAEDPPPNTRFLRRGRAQLEALAAGIEEMQMQSAADDRAQTEALLRAAAALEANEVRAAHRCAPGILPGLAALISG